MGDLAEISSHGFCGSMLRLDSRGVRQMSSEVLCTGSELWSCKLGSESRSKSGDISSVVNKGIMRSG
jgi:hypothetical protein